MHCKLHLQPQRMFVALVGPAHFILQSCNTKQKDMVEVWHC